MRYYNISSIKTYINLNNLSYLYKQKKKYKTLKKIGAINKNAQKTA